MGSIRPKKGLKMGLFGARMMDLILVEKTDNGWKDGEEVKSR